MDEERFLEVAAKIMSEQKAALGKTGTPSSTSPLAEARLEKTVQEIRYLETRIRTAELEEKHLAGTLISVEEAKEIFGRPHAAAAEVIRGMAKQMAPRLYNQSTREIEKSLADWSDGLLELLRRSVD